MDARGRRDNVKVSEQTQPCIHIRLRKTIASVYRVPLQIPAVMARELKANALKLDFAMKDVQIKHPLVYFL